MTETGDDRTYLEQQIKRERAAVKRGKATKRATNGEAPMETGDLDRTIHDLARLGIADYEQQRKTTAERLHLRASILDRLVEAERDKGNGDTKGQGKRLDLLRPDPWPDPVNGVVLMEKVVGLFEEYVKLPERGAIALALWALHTHCYELWRYTPRLFAFSPTKRCGKTRMLRLLKMLVCKPLGSASISASAVYRSIELTHPTLLLDEMDQSITDKPDLVGVLDGGFERGEVAIRTVAVGDDHVPRTFDLFAPCAMAGIGRLPGQLEDRSIKLPMKRALRSERRPKITDETERYGVRLQREIARWIKDNREALKEARPDMRNLPDRVDDRWMPLFAIAEVIGDNWPALAEAAALALNPDDDESDSQGEKLIHDVHTVLRENEEAIASQTLVERLVSLDGRPWAEMGRSGRALTQNKLARLLKPFGIWPRKLRLGAEPVQGYRREALQTAFDRYLDA
ncbi:MAG TPA: DUF3631 domain-containing protein [Acetobacteraceae bacterium]|nr:DUF3631 domain-containing protein [Acetobacteraceae bacterium]